MSERINIPVAPSEYQTRIEVWYEGELNRYGNVPAGSSEVKIRLPADISECEIKLIPCDDLGRPMGKGSVYKSEDDSYEDEDPAYEDELKDCDDSDCDDSDCDDSDCDDSDCDDSYCDDSDETDSDLDMGSFGYLRKNEDED